MAITIRELLASDTVSQAADKINFNFDQLLLNGGGPQGPQGPQGPPGPIGGRGIRGSVWYEGTADPTVTPPTATPEDEDNYLQSNGDVWTYDASIPGWVNTGVNLTGPTGPTGASGKFAEYQALPYTAAGDTTIFPDELSISAIGLTQGVRSVLIGGFPEGPAFTPTSIGTNIVPTAIANQLEMPNISMMVHQFDSSGTAIMFHGGDSSSGEWFSQVSTSELSRITLVADDALRMASPKQRTSGAATFGIYIDAANRGIDLNAGRELRIRTGTATTSDTYPGQDNFSVQVAQSTGNSVEPYASISTIVSGQEAELRIGETSTPATTTTNSGNLVGLAGKISLIGSDAMNLRTADSITVDAGTFIDIDASTDIDINAGSTIDMIGAGLVTVQSTGNNLRLWATGATSVADLYANQDVTVHAKTGDVYIYTEAAGGDVLIDTSNTGSQIKLETTGSTAPINLITNGLGSNIQILANLGEIDISAFIVDIDALTIDIDGGGFTVDTNTVAITSLVNDITLTSARDIILKHGSGDEVLIQPTAGGPEVNLKPASGDDVSEINIYHNSAGGNSNLLLRSDDSVDEGQIEVSDGMSLRLTGGDTAGDQVIVEAYRSGSDLAPADVPTFRVDANIHYSGGQKAFARDEYLFASGKYNQSGVGFSMEVLWQKVGNVVSMNGTIVRTAGSTATSGFKLPVLADGTFFGYTLKGSAQSNDTSTTDVNDRITNIQLTSGAGSGTFQFSGSPSAAPGAGDTWSFTGSYLLIP